MKNWKPTTITAIMAILAFLISVYSMGISREELVLSRKVAEEQIEQNRLSVKPLLSFHKISGHYQSTNGIRLHNDGLGPANIDSIKIDPDDGPSRIYFERCEEYIKDSPPEDWDGVYVMKTK